MNLETIPPRKENINNNATPPNKLQYLWNKFQEELPPDIQKVNKAETIGPAVGAAFKKAHEEMEKEKDKRIRELQAQVEVAYVIDHYLTSRDDGIPPVEAAVPQEAVGF